MNTERKAEVQLNLRSEGHGTDLNFMAQTSPCSSQRLSPEYQVLKIQVTDRSFTFSFLEESKS